MNDVETAAIFGNGKPGDGANFLVVGIGASAGGIGALREFFVNVKPDSHVAYVVILHLSPDHDSKLAEVLQGVTKIPVRQVTEKTKIEQDHVYVVPPNKSLGIEDGHISVQPIKGVEERRAPVDIFFRRLAEHLQSRAVAVVLSGTGANGSMGIKRVKEFGGAAFVQNPREAEFNEMPRSSIATELIDSILPVAEIPSRILAYRDRIGAIEIPEEPKQRKSADQQALREIFTQLRLRTGHDFTNYKRATILRRIARRIGVRNLPDIESYAAYLKEHAEEPNALLKDLLISVTNFFRDAKAWEFIEKQVFPRLLQNGLSNKAIRIWVAGCATGEEAYSIAMIAAEQIFELPEVPTVQIFATDIDEQAIAIAREGTYTLNDAADVSPERLRRFFSKDGDNYRVKRELREMVLFANHNVLKDPPFSHLDIATCRNLMIYLNHEAQERIMETLHFALNPGGYLFVGSSESIDGAGDLFAPLSKQKHVFQSRQVTTRPLPIPESVPEFRSLHIQSQKTEDTANEKSPLERITYNLLHVKLLEQYAPPSVVVNENYDIVHLSSAAGKYLRVAGGEPTNNLMRLVLPDLRLDLRTALYQAVRQRTNVEAENVKVKTREGDEKINILVRPVLDDKDTSRGFILVVFEQEGKAKVVKHESVYAQPEPLAQQLEEELIRSKSQLHSALEQAEIQSEELRASNEELQAMNEELRSSAEELETGKEELQSINEEMATVNQELKVKIEELSHTNNNFTNLLNSIDIGVIFLDRGLRINLFSPAASRIFNLIPGDIGRPLSDITSRLDYGDLPADADHVLEKLQTVEREVETAGGEVFVMRVVPYRTVDDHINGVVLTFVEITERKRAEKGLRESKARLQSLANLVPDLLWETDPDGLTTWFNQRWMEYTGQTLEEAVGWGWTNAIHPDDRKASARRYKEAVEKGEPLRQEHRILRHDAAYRWFIVNAFPLKDENGRVIKMYGSATDIHDHRVAMEAIRFSEERMRALMDSFTEIAIFTTDTEGIVTAWNPGSEKIFGYAAEEMIGKQSADVIFTADDREKGEARRERRTALREGKAAEERWHARKDETRFYASGFMVPLTEGERHIGFGKIAQDLSERERGHKAIRERGMLKRLVDAQEEERQRIARDLHDQLGQQLTALRLKLEGLKTHGAEPAMMKAIDETQSQAKKIDDELSFLTWELRPTELDNLGLRNALASYVTEWSKNYEIPAEFHTAKSGRAVLAPETEVNLYRIAQEALNNVLKHARAKKVSVLLEFNNGEAVLVIEDNGRGFNPKSAARRSDDGKDLGLIGMRERAVLLGGSLEVESARGKGTTIIARVPIRSSANGTKGNKINGDPPRKNA